MAETDFVTLLFLLGAGLWAGVQNALAGGGSFVTLPALMLAGLDARVANLTSTVALFPGQIASGLANRRLIGPVGPVPFRALLTTSLAGGAVGAGLLLVTPSDLFRALLPWLVLAATLLFARGAFGRPLRARHPGAWWIRAGQGLVAVYGGYFGGGIGFLMLALFTLGGAAVKVAQAGKNALAAAMNAAAAAVFAASGEVAWAPALALGAGALGGSWLGARLISRLPNSWLKRGVVALGLALFVGLLARGQAA